MKTPKMTVHIPEPCHEDWNKMLPDEKGKFCLSCSKSVVDFTGKSDMEIHQILIENTGKKLCGRFTKTQLNRPLNIRVNLADLPKNVSSTHSFAIAIFLVFGSMLFSCTDSFGQKMGKVEIVSPMEKDREKTLGEVSVAPPKTDKPIIMMGAVSQTLPPDSVKTEIDTTLKGDIIIEEPIMGKMIMHIPEISPDSLIAPPEQEVKFINSEQEEFTSGGMVAIEYHEAEENQEAIAEMLNENSIYTDSHIDLLVYPNPGANEMTFAYELKRQGAVLLEIYSERGELLKTLVRMDDQYAGQYRIPANLSDLSPGIYFATMLQDGIRVTKRMVIGR